MNDKEIADKIKSIQDRMSAVGVGFEYIDMKVAIPADIAKAFSNSPVTGALIGVEKLDKLGDVDAEFLPFKAVVLKVMIPIGENK